YPELLALQQRGGFRSIMAAPLLLGDDPIGVIAVSRLEVRPFTEREIALLETFADQAVIAISNADLFQQLQERNRSLSDALERETATSEILRVISQAPTDLPKVLNAIAETAARLSDSRFTIIQRLEGDYLVTAGLHA